MKSSAIPVGIPAIPGIAGVDTAAAAAVAASVSLLLAEDAGASVGSVGRPSPLALKNRARPVSKWFS